MEKTANPVPVIVIFVLFLLSVAVVIISLSNKKSDIGTSVEESTQNVTASGEGNEESLSKYFENLGSSGGAGSQSIYLETDPFKEVCLNDGTSKQPYVVSGTVCYY
jgi:hypothetical protein